MEKTGSQAVSERIARVYPTLPGAMRAFAKLVMEKPLVVARTSIHGAVKEVGVSVATANRFARLIGYKGYAEFRSELIRGFEGLYRPIDKLEASLKAPGTPAAVIASSLAAIQRNIEMTQRNLSTASCNKAVTLIARAERRLVIGFDRAAHLGALLAAEMDLRCGHTTSVANADGAIGAVSKMFRLGPRDVVIAIAFPRYFRETIALAQLAKKQRAKVVAITDNPGSPLASLADVSIYVSVEQEYSPNSDATVLAVIESMVAAVARMSPRALEDYKAFSDAALPWFEAP